MKKFILVFFVLTIILPLSWFFYHGFEARAPVADLKLSSLYLNSACKIGLTIRDQGTGLRSVRVVIVQDGRKKKLLEKHYDARGYQGFFLGSRVFSDTFSIPVEVRKYGMTDGEAVFKINVVDFSWKGWRKGNSVEIKRKVIIDSTPPEIDVLTTRHNVARGGSALVIYRLFEEGVKSGVRVGKNFYPGHSGMFKDKGIYAAFFALNYTQGPGTEIFVEAGDPAGNTATQGFYHYIKEKKFRHDNINISDAFLSGKIAEFDLGAEDGGFSKGSTPYLNKFLAVNRELRKKNIQEIFSLMDGSETDLLWSGAFLRLPGSATRAKFADHRIYKYKGREIDRQVHMGIDLASVSRADVPASNRGRVIVTKNIGIFGNTVVLDHGFGLTSIYSHLSRILVAQGDLVEKGEIIGKTGATGLAGGDHLHFGMAVHKTFVNPLEWWDSSWIKNNITSKIKEIGREAN